MRRNKFAKFILTMFIASITFGASRNGPCSRGDVSRCIEHDDSAEKYCCNKLFKINEDRYATSMFTSVKRLDRSGNLLVYFLNTYIYDVWANTYKSIFSYLRKSRVLTLTFFFNFTAINNIKISRYLFMNTVFLQYRDQIIPICPPKTLNRIHKNICNYD